MERSFGPRGEAIPYLPRRLKLDCQFGAHVDVGAAFAGKQKCRGAGSARTRRIMSNPIQRDRFVGSADPCDQLRAVLASIVRSIASARSDAKRWDRNRASSCGRWK